MGDAAALGHAVEQRQPALVVPQHQPAEAQKSVMHIMRRRGRGDAVDEGFGHGADPRLRALQPSPAAHFVPPFY